MAILVSYSPKPLVSIPCSTSTSSVSAVIICSNKQRKKNAAKPKVLQSAKPTTKLKLSQQDDEMLLGIGAGPSTLTALRPRLDEEEPQIASQQDPLSRITLSDAYSSIYIDHSKVNGAFPIIEDGKEELEWGKFNVEGGSNDHQANVEDKYIFYEGDFQLMPEEDEAKIFVEASRELARFETGKRTSKNHRPRYMNGLKEEDIEDAPDNMSMSIEISDEDVLEDSMLLSHAEAELARFEAQVWKGNNRSNLQGANVQKEDIDGTEIMLNEEEYETEEKVGGEIPEIKIKQKTPKRAIPAVMRSFDRAKIYVKAGNGGNGVVAFRREKYVPFGGPSGGSGGRGGHIYIEADTSMNSLLSFRRSVHFRAGRGSHGQGKSQDGAAGDDCTIKVPLGTVIRESADDPSERGEILLELMRPYQRELLLPGGRGGRGNTAFKTGRNKTPQLAEYGEEGAEMWIELELKLVADVGIIGVPNAGKSTLLSVISAAQPAIAAYPFTTLLPNLGVVPLGFEASMVVADLPGLLEGAHLGVGLGHEFLRHTERCRVLVHIVDGMSEQPEQEYEAVRLELELFNPALSKKPYIVAFNKMDIPEASERWNGFQSYMEKKEVEAMCMSAATKMGTQEVVKKAFSLLQSLPVSPYEINIDDQSKENMPVGEFIRRQRSAPIEDFEIVGDKESGVWRIEGVGLERFTQMTNWEYFEAMKRFQQVLNVSGVNKALRQSGVSEGDTVIVGEMEFVWHDSEDIVSSDWKRGFRGSKLWPH